MWKSIDKLLCEMMQGHLWVLSLESSHHFVAVEELQQVLSITLINIIHTGHSGRCPFLPIHFLLVKYIYELIYGQVAFRGFGKDKVVSILTSSFLRELILGLYSFWSIWIRLLQWEIVFIQWLLHWVIKIFQWYFMVLLNGTLKTMGILKLEVLKATINITLSSHNLTFRPWTLVAPCMPPGGLWTHKKDLGVMLPASHEPI